MGACIDSLTSIGIEVNQAIIIPLGIVLWLASLVVAILFVMSYARKVKANKGSTILSLQEMEEAKAAYGEKEIAADAKLSGTQKACLIIFAAAFVVMVIGFIPWGSFGVTVFEAGLLSSRACRSASGTSRRPPHGSCSLPSSSASWAS